MQICEPLGEEDRPPSVATHVEVSGGMDAVTLTFYHVSDRTILRAMDGETVHNAERKGDKLTIRSSPIAKITIPLSVTMPMLADIVETVVQGVPDIKELMFEVGARIAKTFEGSGFAPFTPEAASPKPGGDKDG
ncbi:hypothetical protein [Sorangium cellulosum]|uniref:hypothetical protein n=1 Tax=Sorangium cellulosum TaxID=56 RepID=UPI0012DB71EB|nr:hypothetical protein [Sorangium cellulosum]